MSEGKVWGTGDAERRAHKQGRARAEALVLAPMLEEDTPKGRERYRIDILGPWGNGNGRQVPNEREVFFTQYGFLMACAWFADPTMDNPSKEYVQILADRLGIPVPKMAGGYGGEETR